MFKLFYLKIKFGIKLITRFLILSINYIFFTFREMYTFKNKSNFKFKPTKHLFYFLMVMTRQDI